VFKQKGNNKIIIGDYTNADASSVGTHNGIAGPATQLVDCKATHHRMQLNLYAYNYYENTGVIVDGLCTLLFHPVLSLSPRSVFVLLESR
jgi:hypothetical protein